VVSDLQHLDRCDRIARDQCRLEGGLGIAGEQGGECAHLDRQHDRTVVDVALRKWRDGVRVRGIQQAYRCATPQRQGVTGPADRDRDPGASRIGQKAFVGRIVERDCGVDDGADAESVEHVHEASDVVLVWVAEHHDIDASREELQVRTETPKGQLWIRPSVDEHRRAIGSLHQDGVALADVEHCHVQQAVRSRHHGDCEENGDQRAGNGDWSKEAARHGGDLARRARGCRRGRGRRRASERPAGQRQHGHPCNRHRRRDRHIDGGVGDRCHRRAEPDHDAKDEPRGPSRQPREGIANDRQVHRGVHHAGHRCQRAEQHRDRHEWNDEDIGEWRHE
jgi:hypothetical protein